MTNDAPEADRLEEIKVRATANYFPAAGPYSLAGTFPAAASDITWLVAEVERLREWKARVLRAIEVVDDNRPCTCRDCECDTPGELIEAINRLMDAAK